MNKNQEELFLTVFERNKNRIYRICNSYSNSHENARDLFQDVLLNIWKSLSSFKNNASIDTWIFRITLNVCLRVKSKQEKQQKLFKPIESVELENFQEYIDNSKDNEKLKALYDCIRQLDKSDRSLILLYLEDIPYKSISEITGLSENHVAVKVKRIKNKLSSCLNSRNHG